MPKPDFLKYDLIRYRAIRVTYIPPTNNRGSRVFLYDTWHKKRKYLYFDYDSHDQLPHAQKYLESIGIKIVGQTSTHTDCYDTLLTTNFETSIQAKPCTP